MVQTPRAPTLRDDRGCERAQSQDWTADSHTTGTGYDLACTNAAEDPAAVPEKPLPPEPAGSKAASNIYAVVARARQDAARPETQGSIHTKSPGQQ